LASQAKWNSDRYADYGSYLIDQMSFHLDPTNNPNEDLTKAFVAQLELKENQRHY